jgi:lipid-A-disaccharide synthase
LENVDLKLVDDPVWKIFRQSKLVVAASGTVTLEAAISGTPMVIVYKVSRTSYWLGKLLIRVKHIGLANLIAGRQVVPELLQHEASSKNIANTVSGMLSDESNLEDVRKELSNIKNALGGPGASDRVADIALGML